MRTLAAMLDERFRILTSGDPTTLARHQTMRALIDWSCDLLASPERQLFERLAVFAGGFRLGQTGAAALRTLRSNGVRGRLYRLHRPTSVHD